MNPNDLGGKVILIVADEGRGKTTLAHSLLRRIRNTHNLKVYDEQKQYTEFVDQSRLPTIKDFLADVTKEGADGYCIINNTCIVFEEGTLYFDTYNKAQRLMPLCIGKRHKNNIVIVIFHTLDSIPKNLLRRINYLILFATSDLEGNIIEKYSTDPEIVNLFLDVRENCKSNHHYFNVLSRNNK